MSNKGWIKLHRSIFDNDLWNAEPFTKGQAWIDLIGNANHKACSTWVRGIEIRVERGQISWSELTMAKRWQWSRGKVRRYLGTLKTKQMIVQQNNNLTSIISICNYEVYQSDSTADSTANDTANDTAGGTPDEHQTVHKQECKNEKKERIKDKDSSPTAPAKKKPAIDYSSWPEKPSPQVYEDWKALRKTKRAPITQTVVDQFGKQLNLAKDLGFSVDDCLKIAITNGWSGMKAEWVKNSAGVSTNGQRNKSDYKGSELERQLTDFDYAVKNF